jgi:hypothetical protein
MNDYIKLDSKKYRTNAKNWAPKSIRKPMTVRNCLNGDLDVTYGPGVNYYWDGEIEAPNTADTGWGTYSDLITTLKKTVGVNFEDHYATSYTVHTNPGKSRSLASRWDSTSNKYYVQVGIVAE